MQEDLEYVGFWARFGASMLDTLLMFAVLVPLVLLFGDPLNDYAMTGGMNAFVSYILPAALILWFWSAKQATPGKMAIKARIVDAKTGKAPTTGKLVIRYLAYIVSTIPLCLGYLWVVFDARRQGWHDKLAGTVVVRPVRHGSAPAVFALGSASDRVEPR